MSKFNIEEIGGTDYKYVREVKWIDGSKPNYFKGKIYAGSSKKLVTSKGKTPRECALMLDKKLIELGHEPINILKRK